MSTPFTDENAPVGNIPIPSFRIALQRLKQQADFLTIK
jgi:hypothetical protein